MLDRGSFGGKITNFVNQFYGGAQTRKNCKKVELELIEICKSEDISIEEHDLIIFCHEPEMNLKAANALVREEGEEPERLFKSLRAAENIMHDHESAINLYDHAYQFYKIRHNIFFPFLCNDEDRIKYLERVPGKHLLHELPD